MIIYVDGSVTGNPGGVVGYGWICEEPPANRFGVAFSGGDSATNNIAEYISVASALMYLLQIKERPITVTIRCDSELVVNQLNGLWRVKHANLKPVAAITHMMLEELANDGCQVTAEWIPREQNRVADDLSRRALKQQLKERWPMSRRELANG